MDASDSRCRCTSKIIARDLRLVASRQYRMVITWPRLMCHRYNLPRAGCLSIGTIDLFRKGMGDVSPPMVHLVASFVNHMPHVGAEGCPPLPKRRTPASVVRPHQLELCKVSSRDLIKKDYILKKVTCPLVLNAANIGYPYESTDEFRDESFYTVSIKRQASNVIRNRHFCRILPDSFAAALWCHHCEWIMNLHPNHYQYVTVACSGRKPRGKV